MTSTGTDIDFNLWRLRIRNDTFANYHFQMGKAMLATGEHEPAIGAFQRALDILPDHVDAWRGLIDGFSVVGRAAEADAARVRARAAVDRFDERAAVSTAVERLDASCDRDVLASLVENCRGPITRADAAPRLADRFVILFVPEADRAVERSIDAILSLDPPVALEGLDLLCEVGAGTLSAERARAAMRRLESVVGTHPTLGAPAAVIYWGIGKHFWRESRFAEAVAAFVTAGRCNPEIGAGVADALLNVEGTSLRDEDAPAERRALMNAALFDPSRLDRVTGLQVRSSVLQLHQGRVAAARNLLGDALALAPAAVDPLFELGLCATVKEDYGQALRLLERVLLIDPAHATARCYVPFVLSADGDTDGALAAFEPFLAPSSPMRGWAHSFRGLVLHGLGRLSEAMADYEQGVALAGDQDWSHSNLGLGLMGLGRHHEAEAAQRRALAIEPNRFWPWSNLGVVLLEQGRTAEAMAAFRASTAYPFDVVWIRLRCKIRPWLTERLLAVYGELGFGGLPEA